MNYYQLLNALENKLFNDPKMSTALAGEVSECENIDELKETIAIWVPEIKGDKEKTSDWILNYLFSE